MLLERSSTGFFGRPRIGARLHGDLRIRNDGSHRVDEALVVNGLATAQVVTALGQVLGQVELNDPLRQILHVAEIGLIVLVRSPRAHP